MNKVRVLVAPLDWGLGHASRMIRVVYELKALGCEVILAGSGNSLALMKKEFPGLDSVSLPAYDPVYPKSDRLIFALLKQAVKFLRTIRRERKMINEAVADRSIDLILSDNRYGCRSQVVMSVFISHQMNLLLPVRWKWMEKWVNSFHRYHIRRFNECWIPDWQGSRSLVPALSQVRMPSARYIGPLSRFNGLNSSAHSSSRFSLLVILSGPEPQRSILEEIVAGQLKTIERVCLVRGIPDSRALRVPSQVAVKGLVTGEEMETLIRKSDIIIARSGYSTLMDMVTVGGKAIFIPTPGQTEQEYIGRLFMEKGIAYCGTQPHFRLSEALTKSTSFTGFSPGTPDSTLERVLRETIEGQAGYRRRSLRGTSFSSAQT